MRKSILPIVLACVSLAGCKPAEAPAPSETSAATVSGPERHILAVGDSLFAGYGLAPGHSYPARLEEALRVKKGINARIANAGVSGDTSAAGAQRFAFVLDSQNPKPDLVIVEFGGNDILRGIDPAQTRANLDAMLAEAEKRHIPALLMGMKAAPNLGADYRAKFDPIYPDLAKKHGAKLVPFFLAPVIGHPELIQGDHIHPNDDGVAKIVGMTVGAVEEGLP